MSTMPTKLLNVDEGMQLHAQLMELKKDIGFRFLQVGEILYRMKEEELYRVINPDMSWEAYCSMPELSISPSHARNLMRMYKVMVLELHIPRDELAGIDQRKLTALVPSINQANAEELLENAKVLTRGDLIKTLRTNKDHECEWEVITFERCKICYEERNRQKSKIS